MTLHRRDNIIFIISCIIVLAVRGASFTPAFNQMLLMASDITNQVSSIENYWFNESLLYLLLMSVFDVRGKVDFLIFVFILLFVQVFYMFRFIDKHFQNTFLIKTYFVVSGTFTSCLYWLGFSDPTLLLFGVFVVFIGESPSISTKTKIWSLFVAIIAGLSHYHGAFLILLLGALINLNSKNYPNYFIVLLGVIFGFALVKAFFYFSGDFHGSTRMGYIIKNSSIESIGLRRPEEMFKYLLGFLGGAIAFLTLTFTQRNFNFLRLSDATGKLLRLYFSFALAISLGFLASDTTRVMSWLLWPLTIYFFTHLNISYSKVKLLTFSLLVMTALPAYHYWEYSYHNRPLNNEVYEASQLLFNLVFHGGF